MGEEEFLAVFDCQAAMDEERTRAEEAAWKKGQSKRGKR